MKKVFLSASAALLAVLAVSAKVQAQNINVVINGQPVAFTGVPPQEVNNSVLVPLRGVFEQLGANVQYNPQTKTIFAVKGSTNISLALGSSTAYINNQPQQLAQAPTVMVGTTLVPLRFVAEAFGAYVEWESQSSTVEIQTSPSEAFSSGPPQQQAPPDHQGPTVTTVSGHVIEIDSSNGAGTLTLGTPSGQIQVGIDPHTRFTSRQPGGQPIPSAPEALKLGDDVRAELWPNGTARSIEIRSFQQSSAPMPSTSVNGQILNIDQVGNPSLITVGTSSGPVQVGIDQHTSITENEPGQAPSNAGPDSLRVGDQVEASVWPSGTARSILVNFVERHGSVLSVQNLPDGKKAVVLDSGKVVVLNQHAEAFRHHQPLGRSIQPGDSISVRMSPNGQVGYSIDLN